MSPPPGAHRTGKRASDAPDAPAPGSPAPAPSPSPRSAPAFDARSPATRRELAASPSSDLVASPLMPLEFDLRRLSSVAPSRAKDSAIVALSKQLDAMRSRLQDAERTTPAAANDAARDPRATATATAKATATAAPTAAPTDAAVASTSRRPSTPPQATSARSASPYLTERAKHVAVLRLENEAQEWRRRAEEAERREAAALARVDTERERASREMAAEWATERRRLEVLRFRALARAESRFHERRARIAVGAFRRAVRDARKDRLLERVLLPKFLKMRARAAFSAFARETASRRRVARLETRATISADAKRATRILRAWRDDATRRAAHARRAERKRRAIAETRRWRLVASCVLAWRETTRTETRMETISIRFRARAARRNVVAAFREWARLARREDEAKAFAAERVALATRVAAERHMARRARRVARSFVRAWRVATTARRDARRFAEDKAKRGFKTLLRAWRRVAAAAANARVRLALGAVRRWRAEALTETRRAGVAERAATRAATRRSSRAFRRWRDATARRVVDDARRRAALAEASVQTLGAEVASLGRVAAADRAAAEEASSREKATLVALASAERVASAAAPRGGSLLESPLAWRSLETENDASVPALVASTSLPDPTPPVFLPDVDPDAYRPVDDGAPPSAGDVVVIFAGASESMVAATLRLETRGADDPSKESAWTLEPTARWTPLGPDEVAGKAPAPRQNPATCALPAATAATAAAAGGADPGGVVGGVFVFGGHDGEDETNDAHVLIRRTREEGSEEGSEGGSEGSEGSSRGNTPRPAPEWEWVRLPNAPFSPAPPRRSHAAAFAAPTPLAGSPAASSSETRVDVYVMGGYRSGAEAGGVRNDLWRLDAATLTWSSPETFGDVPAPRRDAAIATTCASASGAGRVFVHGGRAADGEALADCHVLDIADMTWTRLPPDAYADADVVGGRPGDGDFFAGKYGVAAEMAALDSRADAGAPRAFPRLAHPSPRSHHAATVVGSTLLVHGGDAFGADDAPRALDLETMSWRALRVAGDDEAGKTRGAHPRPPANRCFGHAMFPHVSGVVLVCGGASGTTLAAPPAYVLELPGARESRRLRAAAVADADDRGALADRARRADADAAAARDETRLVRAAAAALKDEADAVARAEEAARRAAKTLREKYLRAKRRAEDAEAKKEDALANAESAAARSDVAWVKIEAHAREARDARRARDVAVEEARDAREDAAVAAEAVARFRRERDAAVEAKETASTAAARADALEMEIVTLRAAAEAAEAARSAAEREKLRADAVADAEATRARTLENHLRVVEASRTTVAEEAETQRRALRDEIVALEAEVARATAERWAADADEDDDTDQLRDEDDAKDQLPARLVSMLELDRPAWDGEGR